MGSSASSEKPTEVPPNAQKIYPSECPMHNKQNKKVEPDVYISECPMRQAEARNSRENNDIDPKNMVLLS